MKKAIQQSDKQTNDLTDKKEFQPTPHMLVWLDTQARIMTDVVDEIARQSKISDASWYNWLKLDGFEDWYWPEYDRRTRRLKPTVDRIGLKFAERGSPQHFEYLAKRVGNIKDAAQQTNVQVIAILGGKSNEVQSNDSNEQVVEAE